MMLQIPVSWPFTAYLFAAMLIAVPLVMWATRLSASQAGWRWGGWATVALGMGWGGLLGVGAAAWLRQLMLTGNYLPIPMTASSVDWLLLVLAAPVVEEFFFRGVVFGNLQRTWHPFWAVVLSSGGYAAVHSAEPWVAMQFLAAAGFALAFRQAGSVVAPMLAHALAVAALLMARAHPAVVLELSAQTLGLVAAGCAAIIIIGSLGRRKS